MNNNPNIDKDKWLESFKDSLSDYSTPTPKNGWERVNSSISKQKKIASFKKITATILSSAAAILLLFLLINRGEETQIDNKLASNSKPSIEVIDNILNEDKEDNEKVKESNKDKDNRIDNKNYNNKSYIGNQNTSKTNKIIQPIIPAQIDTSNNINNIHISTDTLEITDYIATNNIINEQKEEIDNRLSWDEYLKQEEADKIKVANNKNRTLLAIAAGSNGISNTSNTTNNNLRQNSPDISLGYISSYYNPYMEYTHKQPISFGVYFGKNIKNFSIETGITYTYLRSDIRGLKVNGSKVTQSLNYIGIPLRFNWNFINKHKYSVYAGAGGFIERCIYASIDGDKVDIKKWQGGFTFNAGAQFKFTDHIAIYLEPGLVYYIGMPKNGEIGKFNNNLSIKSIRSEHPLGFSISAGFRFAF